MKKLLSAVILCVCLGACCDKTSTPKDIEDLGANYTGVFAGVLPCADCGGIDVLLTLSPDSSYRLQQTYLGKEPGSMFIMEGLWLASEDLGSVTLVSNNDGGEHYAFKGKNRLEKLDIQGNPIESKLNYTLKRVK